MRISTNGQIVGLDLGYGNIKIVGGDVDGSGIREYALPAGAAPADSMPKQGERPDLKGGEAVIVDGSLWVAGVEQFHIQNATRQTHENYSDKPEYKALFLAGLARLGMDRISVLVTGLPVSQFYGPEGAALKARLVALMQGKHHVNDRLTVSVDKVIVVPQPYGTFMSLATRPQHKDLATRDDVSGLCADFGFYSADTVVMSGQSVMDKYSGSSQLATSHILERVANRLQTETTHRVNRDRLDMLFRNATSSIRIGGEDVDYLAILREEGDLVAGKVADAVLANLRSYATGMDYLILTGGGADLYEPAFQRAFPNAAILRPEDPVLANARGYFAHGRLWQAKRDNRPVAATA